MLQKILGRVNNIMESLSIIYKGENAAKDFRGYCPKNRKELTIKEIPAWIIDVETQDKIIAEIVGSPAKQLSDMVVYMLKKQRSNLVREGTFSVKQFEDLLNDVHDKIKAANPISEVGNIVEEKPSIDEELLPKMNKDLYLQRLRASIERDSKIQTKRLSQINEMSKEKRKILEAMLEAMRRD
jgi:hypothetical protein